MPRDDVIDKRRSRKAFLLQTLILNYGLKWDYNKHALALFYYFIVAHEQQLCKVPKGLAMMLYMRFSQMIEQKRQQKKQMYELIKPNLYEELEQVKQERNRACANMFRNKKLTQKSKSSEEGNPSKGQGGDQDDYDIEGISNIEQLSLEESQFEEQALVEEIRSQVEQSLLQEG